MALALIPLLFVAMACAWGFMLISLIKLNRDLEALKVEARALCERANKLAAKFPVMKCGTTICEAPATHRFTWPGRDEQLACETCAARARGVAAAMGLHLQVLPLELLTFELEPLGELRKPFIEGLLASGMRETKCTGCGCELYTRGDDDRCPPCRAAQKGSSRS